MHNKCEWHLHLKHTRWVCFLLQCSFNQNIYRAPWQQTHACMHACMHTYIHRYMHTHMLCAVVLVKKHFIIFLHIHTHTHTHTHTFEHLHTPPHTHTHLWTPPSTRYDTHIHLCTCSHIFLPLFCSLSVYSTNQSSSHIFSAAEKNTTILCAGCAWGSAARGYTITLDVCTHVYITCLPDQHSCYSNAVTWNMPKLLKNQSDTLLCY